MTLLQLMMCILLVVVTRPFAGSQLTWCDEIDASTQDHLHHRSTLTSSPPSPPSLTPRCAEIDASTQDPLHHRAALMHVAAERAEAVVIICLPCEHNDAVAAANVVRLDPPSQGVALERVQPLSLDVGLTDVTAHFSGVGEVGVSVFISGWLEVAGGYGGSWEVGELGKEGASGDASRGGWWKWLHASGNVRGATPSWQWTVSTCNWHLALPTHNLAPSHAVGGQHRQPGRLRLPDAHVAGLPRCPCALQILLIKTQPCPHTTIPPPTQMAASIGSLGACGFLIRARQACAAPQLTYSRFKVGAWHAADVPIVVKGTRPPMKVGGGQGLGGFLAGGLDSANNPRVERARANRP